MNKNGVKGPKGTPGFTDQELQEAYAWGYQLGFFGGSTPEDVNQNDAVGSAYISGYIEGYADYTTDMQEAYDNL